ELNVDSTGTLRIWVNGDDPKAIYQALIGAVGNEMAAYIMAYKLFGQPTRLDANGNPIQSVTLKTTTQSGSGSGSGGGRGGQAGGKGGQQGGGTIPLSGTMTGKQQKVRVASVDELIAAVEDKLGTTSTSGRAINSLVDLMQTRVTLPRLQSGSS